MLYFSFLEYTYWRQVDRSDEPRDGEWVVDSQKAVLTSTLPNFLRTDKGVEKQRNLSIFSFFDMPTESQYSNLFN